MPSGSTQASQTPSWKQEIVDESVLVARYERPPTNRLSGESLIELARLLDRSEGDGSLKCLVIASGVDGHFIGDTDDAEWERIASAESPQSELVPWHRACSRLASYPLPTIAAIDGKVAGTGLDVSLCTDIRIAGAGAAFDFSSPTSGSIPYSGGTQRLPRIVGKPKAMELILSGAVLTAAEAAACGLVQRATAGSAIEETMALAKIVASRPRPVVAALKTAVGGSDVPLAEGLALESRLAASLLAGTRPLGPSDTGAGDPPDDERRCNGR